MNMNKHGFNSALLRDLATLILEDFKKDEVKEDFKEWYLKTYGEEYEF